MAGLVETIEQLQEALPWFTWPCGVLSIDRGLSSYGLHEFYTLTNDHTITRHVSPSGRATHRVSWHKGNGEFTVEISASLAERVAPGSNAPCGT